MKVIKKFGIDFDSDGGALTLRPSDVGVTGDDLGLHTYTHERSGWTITGKVVEDHYTWINEFKATHPLYGSVKGNFERKVVATSEARFNHFYKNHPPESWDYEDI